MAFEDVGGLAGWVLAVVDRLGYAGIALLVALETFVPPIPSEIVLPASGFLVSRGAMTFAGVLAAATAGSVAGALALYEVGRRMGPARVARWVARRGRWVGVAQDDLDRAQSWFRRRGDWAVLAGRLVPGVRSLVSLPAGLAPMPLGRFLVMTTLGSLAWNALLVGLGWQLGARWDRVEPFVDGAGWAAWTALALLAAWWIARRRRRHRDEAAQGARGAGRA